MNKKGFTIVELLVVIVIIALITSIATISITRNRNFANDKEIVTLRQNIISAFSNFRIDNNVNKEQEVGINNFSFANRLSYNKDYCSYGSESTIRYVIKKDKVNDVDLSAYDEITKNKFKEYFSDSNEEVFCIKFYCNDELIIDDDNNLLTKEVLEIEGKKYQVNVNYCE